MQAVELPATWRHGAVQVGRCPRPTSAKTLVDDDLYRPESVWARDGLHHISHFHFSVFRLTGSADLPMEVTGNKHALVMIRTPASPTSPQERKGPQSGYLFRHAVSHSQLAGDRHASSVEESSKLVREVSCLILTFSFEWPKELRCNPSRLAKIV